MVTISSQKENTTKTCFIEVTPKSICDCTDCPRLLLQEALEEETTRQFGEDWVLVAWMEQK
jgi:hypothetical protein